MPYTDDMTPTSEFSFLNFTQTTFDPATTEGYVSGVVGDVLVGLSAPLVTLTDGTQYTVRYANKLIELGQLVDDEVVWSPISLAEYDTLQGIPDIIAIDNTVIITWSENDTVHVLEYLYTNPLATVDVSFDGISSALTTTLQFGICCVYIGLDGCIHIMERGVSTWSGDNVMSSDLADDTVRVARAFYKLEADLVSEKIALLMFRVGATIPEYFYMMSESSVTTGTVTTDHVDTVYPVSDIPVITKEWIGIPDAENTFNNINDVELDTSSYIYSIEFGTQNDYKFGTTGIPDDAVVSRILINCYIETEHTGLFVLSWYKTGSYVGSRTIVEATDPVIGWYQVEYLISKTGLEIQDMRVGLQQQERVYGSVSKIYEANMVVYYTTTENVVSESTIIGFTTELTTWEQVKAIAGFTWPEATHIPRLITCTEVDLNGSFFVTPSSVSSSDTLVYGAVIKGNQMYVTGEADVDAAVPDNGTGVLAKEISLLRGDAERKALRFVTSVSGRVKLECPQVEAQASDAGEVEAIA